jgi:hypothetical protein
MKAIMLIEVWERLRGVNQWPETTATVSSINRYAAPKAGGFLADVSFNYQDKQGEYQSGLYKVESHSSLYNFKPGDTFPLRFNPTRPQQYFSPEYGKTSKGVLWGYILLTAFLIWLTVFILQNQ